MESDSHDHVRIAENSPGLIHLVLILGYFDSAGDLVTRLESKSIQNYNNRASVGVNFAGS